MNLSQILRSFFFLLLLLTLGACAPMVKDGQPTTTKSDTILRPGQTIGQTFTARDRGLNGVEVFLSPDTPGVGEIRLHLRANSQSSADIAVGTLPEQAVSAPGFYRFAFAPQSDSRGHDYYLLLDVQGEGKFRVGTAVGDTYLDGALYQNGNPLDAQMAFRLSYDPGDLAIGLAALAATWFQVLIVAILLFVLPGWALLALLLPGWSTLSWGERLGLAAGLSLALYPLLLLWTAVFDLHLGLLYAWVPALAAIGVLVWHNRAWRPGRMSDAWRAWRQSPFVWSDLALVVFIGLIVITRFWVIRSLDVPMWGDSYQHTMIAQLLVNNGGLFDSWQPYAPYRTLTVQFGFPTAAAVFSWLTETSSVRAALWVGQILNVLAIIALYPLAVRIAQGNRWAGVGAVLIGGLLSPMPAFYVNWGRYAQLAGQCILPASLWLLWETVEDRRFSWQKAFISGTVLAGMMLNYYRMPFYYATFILSWLVGWGVPRWRLDKQRWLQVAVSLALVAGLALLFFLPWMVHISQGSLANAVEGGVAQGSAIETVLSDYRVWNDVLFFVPAPLIVIALLGLGWSLVRKHWCVASLGLWVIALSLLVAGGLIRMPGANMMQNFAVLITLYIPVSLLGGWLISQIAQMTSKWSVPVGLMVTTVVLVGVGFWSARDHLLVEQPKTFALVTRPDIRAMAWIREHTPMNARFLVEGFRIYAGKTSVGADAGWWIPLLAGRSNTMPPQYALVNEVPTQPGYTERVTDLIASLESVSPSSSEGLRFLCDWGITHVYIGQGQGKTGAGAVQLFPPAPFIGSTVFDLIYHQDRIYVFTMNRRHCEMLE